MSLSPISFIASNFRDNKNEWLKAFEPGTTTPKTMALDAAGAVTVSKLQLNADGFIVTAGAALVIPYIDGAYDLWLFPTEAEADANDTSSALRLADDILGVSGLGAKIQPLTLAEAVANTSAQAGQIVQITDRADGQFEYLTGQTPNTYNIVACTGDPSLSLVLRSEGTDYLIDWFGADTTNTVDASGAMNAAIQEGGVNSVIRGSPGAFYRVDEPIIINHGELSFLGYGCTIDAKNFNVGTNKGVIECLVRKNGVNLRSSQEFNKILGWRMEGDGIKEIAGIAASGFNRGSEISDCRIQGFYNGAQLSGSFSFAMKRNIIQSNINVDILLGEDILMDVDGIGGYTDGGVNPILPQEGFEFTPGSISIQCNAVSIDTQNRVGGSKHGYSCHFGNAINFNGNTVEIASGLGVKITALESGEFIGNYSEGNAGWMFGRDSGGIVSNMVQHSCYMNNTNLYFIGFTTSHFHTNNKFGGTPILVRGTIQRNFGNTTDQPNASNRADVGIFQNSYTYVRDGLIDRNDEAYVTHHGLIRTNLDFARLESGLSVTDQNDTGVPTGKITENQPFEDVVTKVIQTVTTSNVVIGSVARSSMYIVHGEDSTLNTRRFIDVILAIGGGTVVVIGTHSRSTPAARTYSMSGGDLQVLMAADTYLVSVRGFNGTDTDVGVTI